MQGGRDAGRFRALLVGVGEYPGSPTIKPLPFVQADLTDLRTALTSRGYEVSDIVGPEVGRTSVMGAIQGFLRQARKGDRLLIVLSGHGVHIGGADYLVPSDADTALDDFTDCLVEIRWDKPIENSAAASVLVLVDACREGVDLGTKTLSALPWSTGKRDLVANREVAYVFSCSPGQYAWYVSGTGGEFSVFSRAFADVLRDPATPADLAGVKAAVQERLSELSDEHNRARQDIRIRTERDLDSFVVFPRADGPDALGAGEDGDPWVAVARDHGVWKLVTDTEGAEALRESTLGVVAELARRRRAAERTGSKKSKDPWHDHDVALRTTERLQFLVGQLGSDVSWTPAEAALLVVMPFLRHTLHAAYTADLVPAEAPASSWLAEPTDPDLADLVQFSRSFPRLRRRVDAARRKEDDQASAAISWWLFNRWARRRLRLDPQADEAIAAVLPHDAASMSSATRLIKPLITEVFTPSRLSALELAMDGDPGLLADTDRPAILQSQVTVRASTKWEQEIRERLLAYLLMLAAGLAIDPAWLGEVLVDHLGIGDSVDLTELRECVAASVWQARGRSRVLQARCPHPAIDLALREHVTAVGTILDAVHTLAATDANASALAMLPTTVSADEVAAAEVAGGGKAYDSAGMRFRLADDRVQELLMGEQLYQNRALAIRELYQNALDACRYRRARSAYLTATGHTVPEWRGRISFEQGVDEQGRPYLDCADNGIGMGVRELREVFSQAGARFTHLPEFVQEQAEWERQDPPIMLFPNSRFGIGVLSYFMLAEEIVVTTCRMGRSGELGENLQVVISGPGSIFRIHRLPPATDAGTTVRLYLNPTNPPPSCVRLLGGLLWVAEFDTEAREGAHALGWDAGALSPVAPIGAPDPLADDAERIVNGVTGRDEDDVWWCGGLGAVLADGIWSGLELFGAVVNLTGPHAPTLSIDRTSILDYDSAEIERMLVAAAPSITTIPTPSRDYAPERPFYPSPPPGSSPDIRHSPEEARARGHVTALGGYFWLSSLAAERPAVADALLLELARDPDRAWTLSDRMVAVSAFGCLPSDCLDGTMPFARPGALSSRPEDRRPVPHTLELAPKSGEAVSAWRSAAFLVGSGLALGADGLPRQWVLAMPSDAVILQGCESRRVTREQLRQAAAALEYSVPTVAKRMEELGFIVPHLDIRNETDIEAEKPIGNGEQPVAPGPGNPSVNPFAKFEDLSWLLGDADEDRQDELFQWLAERPASPVTRAHVVRTAAVLRCSVSQIAAKLAEFGLTSPDITGLPVEALTEMDEFLLSRGLGWRLYRFFDQTRWWPENEPVPRAHVIQAARESGWNVTRVAARLEELGLLPPDITMLAERPPTDDDLCLLNSSANKYGSPLSDDEVVSHAHVARTAVLLECSVGQIARQLGSLGYISPGLTATREEQIPTPEDGRLLTRDLITPSRAYSPDQWLTDEEIVSKRRLVRAAAGVGRSVPEVAARLVVLGFDPLDIAALPKETLSEDDLRLLSHNLIGRADDRGIWNRSRWLTDDEINSHGHLVRAAARLGKSVLWVARRLKALGFDTPNIAALPKETLNEDDLRLLSRNLKGWQDDASIYYGDRWWPEGETIPVGHLVLGARRLRQSIREVAARLHSLGMTVPGWADLPDEIPTAADTRLFTHHLQDSFESESLSDVEVVSRAHLVRAAVALGWGVPDVVTRLEHLGLTVPPVDFPPAPGGWFPDPDEVEAQASTGT